MNKNQLWQLYKQRVDDCDGRLAQASFSFETDFFEEKISEEDWIALEELSNELDEIANAHWDLYLAFSLMDEMYKESIDKPAE